MGGYHHDSGRENPSSVDISGRELTQAIYVSQGKTPEGSYIDISGKTPACALYLSQKNIDKTYRNGYTNIPYKGMVCKGGDYGSIQNHL